MHSFCSRRGNRGTFGEALIVITAMAGFFYAMNQGLATMANLWNFVWFLLVVAGFYFLLLFARMLFFWMTGGDHAAYGNPHWAAGAPDPWWTHQGKPVPPPPAPKKK